MSTSSVEAPTAGICLSLSKVTKTALSFSAGCLRNLMQPRHGSSWKPHQNCYVFFKSFVSNIESVSPNRFFKKMLRFMMKSDAHGKTSKQVSSDYCFKFRQEKMIQTRYWQNNVSFIYTDCICEKYSGSQNMKTINHNKVHILMTVQVLFSAVFLTGKMVKLFALCSFGIFRNTCLWYDCITTRHYSFRSWILKI